MDNLSEAIQEMAEGWRTITYPISLQYRKEWGMWEAIREIKQNALDECGGFIETRYSDGLEIRDKGNGLAVRHLLFGVSDKDGVTTRGKFAEGLKIAMVVCLRNNSMFSYDLWDVKLSESRGIASEWDVHSEIGKMWSAVDSVELFVRLFQALKAGMYEAKCDFWWTFDHPDKLTKAFHIVFGEKAVIQTSQEAANEALWLGANPVQLPKNISGILKSTSLADEAFVKLRYANAKAKEVPEDKLTKKQLDTLHWLRKFPRHLIFKSVIIKPFILSDDDAQRLTIGKVHVIRISTRILAHKHAALAALIHELAHVAGAKDMTPEMILRVAKLGATAYLNKEEIERNG